MTTREDDGEELGMCATRREVRDIDEGATVRATAANERKREIAKRGFENRRAKWDVVL